jgi:hypothetical protein
MSNICEVIIYTSQAEFSFYVEATTANFQERLAAALEEGTVMLDTVEGSKLMLNAINVVAIEVRTATEYTAETRQNIPPHLKSLILFFMNRV